jgi:nitronate monooxygenase
VDIADGRINMGTRFMATKEAPIHDSIKQELVKGTERDTALIMRSFRNTSRIYKVAEVISVLIILEYCRSASH